jgi:hypothetical protein
LCGRVFFTSPGWRGLGYLLGVGGGLGVGVTGLGFGLG